MFPRGLLQPLHSVSFERKIQFSAGEDLSFMRSEYLKLRDAERRREAQSVRPPDFSVKLYSCVSHKTGRHTHLKAVGPQPSETKRRHGHFLTNLLSSSPTRTDPPEFITAHRPPDALQTELMFVQAGKHPCGTYRNPKPHNFRPVSVCRLSRVFHLQILLMQTPKNCKPG